MGANRDPALCSVHCTACVPLPVASAHSSPCLSVKKHRNKHTQTHVPFRKNCGAPTCAPTTRATRYTAHRARGKPYIKRMPDSEKEIRATRHHTIYHARYAQTAAGAGAAGVLGLHLKRWYFSGRGEGQPGMGPVLGAKAFESHSRTEKSKATPVPTSA